MSICCICKGKPSKEYPLIELQKSLWSHNRCLEALGLKVLKVLYELGVIKEDDLK